MNYRYFNAGNNTVLQAKNLTAGQTSTTLYGLEQISQGDTSTTSRQYPVTDGVGTVRYLTNNSGTTITSGAFAYDPYGKQTGGSATLANYNFQSEQKDNESGMVYLRARYYDPTIGRFASQDPVSGMLSSPAPQNGYNYANNNPVNLADPTGELPTIVIGAIIGAAAGAVTNGVTYVATADHFSTRDFLASAGGGALSGAITGGCLGSGVGLLAGAGCGAAGNFVGDWASQLADSKGGVSAGHIAGSTALGFAGGFAGGFLAKNAAQLSINKGWLALANNNPGGLSAKNLLPWMTTGSLGNKLQLNNLVGGVIGLGTNLPFEAMSNKCPGWGSL